MMKRLRLRIVRVSFALVVTIVGAAAVSYATATWAAGDPTGVITACRSQSTGALRVGAREATYSARAQTSVAPPQSTTA